MKIRNMVLAGLFAALLCICSWISLPLGSLRFTLQTFALFLALLTIGGKWGSLTVLVYIGLGAMGLPVFSGFQGGIGVIAGPTGGCIIGFMLTTLLYWLAELLPPGKIWVKIAVLCLGLLICYGIGWLWYCQFAPMPLLAWCLPYLLPDAGKLALAVFLSQRLGKAVQN